MSTGERIGWVVEGPLEERVLPALVRRHLRSRSPRLPVERLVGRAIADGGDKIRNAEWVSQQVGKLRQGGHRHVVVVADQERHPSPEAVRERLRGSGADAVFVASPKFERWLLADADAVQAVLGGARPADWRAGEPLDVLHELKRDYKKLSDGTLLGDASQAAAWALAEREFCSLLRCIEAWLRVPPTECAPPPQSREATPRRRARR